VLSALSVLGAAVSGTLSAEALAGCAAQAPELIGGPSRMPQNGALSLVLTHPLWHSRRAATGTAAATEKLGPDVEDLPFVLTRAGSPEPLRIRATRSAPRGRVIVELMPAAGWVAGAAYELRCDVSTKRVYPGFSATDATDRSPPAWGSGTPRATIVRPPPPPPPSLKERCVTTGRGSRRTITCSVTSSAHAACPPRVEEAHVRLRLPPLSDDQGGVLTLEIVGSGGPGAGAATTWMPADREILLGRSDACGTPNFPPPDEKPYELLVTPIDAAGNRGAALRIPVDPKRS
jgi:hypothetical protein